MATKEKIVQTGNSDFVEDYYTRFSLETYERLPNIHQDEYLKEWIDAIEKYKITEQNSSGNLLDNTWPLSLRKESGKTTDVKESTNWLKQHLDFINCSIFKRLYEDKYHGRFVNELNLEDFVQRTAKFIKTNISAGSRIIVSRVLETNVEATFSSIYQDLVDSINKGNQPIIELQLVPIASLSSIAKNESDRLAYLVSKGCPKHLLLSQDKGISTISPITHLRHTWLYLGTATFAYAFHKKYDKNFRFFYGNTIPSARDTLILKKPGTELRDSENYTTPKETLFVQLKENAIGLDGVFYQDKGKTDLDKKLYEETINARIELSSKNDFDRMYVEAMKIENTLYANNSFLHKEISTDVNLMEIEKNPEFGELPSATKFWEGIFKKIHNDEISIQELLQLIKAKQDSIDKSLAGVRKTLE